MLTALASGILLGLSAGLSPGPMLALVLAQTVRHGAREGCKIALAPLLTDAPIILLAWVTASRLAELRPLLAIVSMAGSVFVLYLAWESCHPPRQQLEARLERPRSWLKGITTNLLNPHPWLFWLTVGSAMLAQSKAAGWTAMGAFLTGFYALLVGSKVMMALLAGRSRDLLAGRAYRVVLRVLGGMLGLFALFLFREGLRQLGMI